MLLYVFIAIWPLFVQYIYKYRPLSIEGRRIKKNYYLILALLPVFILLAFRGQNMGADTSTYIRHFISTIDKPIGYIIDKSRMEIGYLFFVKFITYITNSPLFYQVICVSFMFVGLYSFLKELETEDALLFIYFYCTLGVLFFMFTGTRQCLAMAICLFSYKFLKKQQYIRLLLCVLVSIFFHKSAILFLLILFIYNRGINIFNIVLYCILSFVIGRNLNSIQMFLNDTLNYAYNIEYTGNGAVFLIVLLLLSVFSLIMIYNHYGSFNVPTKIKLLININFVTLVFWIMRLQTRVAERPSYYFIFFSCAFYANALNSIDNTKERRFYKILIYSLTMLLYIYRLKTNFSSLTPFEFY